MRTFEELACRYISEQALLSSRNSDYSISIECLFKSGVRAFLLQQHEEVQVDCASAVDIHVPEDRR
jgi:hypothetical protein